MKNKVKTAAVLLAAVLLIIALIGCDKTDKDDAAGTAGTTETETEAEPDPDSKYYPGYDWSPFAFPAYHDYMFPEWSLRTTWNFSFKIARRDEYRIYVWIYDNDYIGMYYNPHYFVLDKWQNGEWQMISGIKEKYINGERMYSPYLTEGEPPLAQICIEYKSLTEELTAGKYRMTVILDSREAFFEFELDENLDPVETPPTELE